MSRFFILSSGSVRNRQRARSGFTFQQAVVSDDHAQADDVAHAAGQASRIADRSQGISRDRPAQGAKPMEMPDITWFQIEGVPLAVRIAGDVRSPAMLLIHGFPSSSTSFREVFEPLSRECFVIAPDLPGFGESEPMSSPSFTRFADLLEGLLVQLGVAAFHVYLHDYGAAVGLHLATRVPERIRSLIIQNANAHESGMGPAWAATRRFWNDPTPRHEVDATAHLSYEGTRDQYIGGVPDGLAKRIDPRRWEEDWRIMSLTGRIESHRALVFDYRQHVARFGAIADHLREWQPPALMLWGRHDAFFDIEETLSWMKALPRMEAHILDGPHFLLETHAGQCAELMLDFLRAVHRARSLQDRA
jgi:pimeloyl-ACP methyl ester carboxylesterase